MPAIAVSSSDAGFQRSGSIEIQSVGPTGWQTQQGLFSSIGFD